MNFRFLGFLLLCLFVPTVLSAKLFTVDINTSDSESFFQAFNNIDDAIDQLDENQLSAALPSYNEFSTAATSVLNYRGLPMIIAYPIPGSSLMTLNIPLLGLSETFVGANRDESADLLLDYFEGGLGNSVNRIQKELARVSSTDPVAGNPNSMMATMASTNFSMGVDVGVDDFYNFAAAHGGPKMPRKEPARSGSHSEMGKEQVSAETGSGEDHHEGGEEAGHEASVGGMDMPGPSSSRSLFGIEISHEDYDLDGIDAKTETITLDYQYRFASDARKRIKFSMPVSISDVDGAESYKAQLGVNFTFPVNDYWVLTPGASYGLTGSEDLGGGAAMTGFSLVSSLRFMFGNFMFNMGNMIGDYETESVSVGDYDLDPEISNTIYRNGLVMMTPIVMFETPTVVQFFIIDTQYSGDDLFTEHYREFGFAFGLLTNRDLVASRNLNLGFTYLDSEDANIDGFKLNFGYKF